MPSISGRIQAMLAIFFLGLLAGTSRAQRFNQDLLGVAIEKLAKEIPVDSLQLPEIPETGAPPAPVSVAAADFVEAWKLYRNVTVNRPHSPDVTSPLSGDKDHGIVPPS